MSKIIFNIVILLFAIFTLVLNFQGKLDFYIHPRYITFTFVAALVSIIVSVLNIALNIQNTKAPKLRKTQRSLFISVFILFIPIVLGFVLPVAPLSSSTANQRSLDFNTLRSSEASTLDLFAADTEKFNIGEWVASFNTNPELEDYIDKKVRVTGFIFRDETLDNDYFLVSRFVITCCAVDARPVGIVVKNENWNEFEENQWIEVNGIFAVEEIDGVERVVIVESEINKIEIPNDPYLY